MSWQHTQYDGHLDLIGLNNLLSSSRKNWAMGKIAV